MTVTRTCDKCGAVRKDGDDPRWRIVDADTWGKIFAQTVDACSEKCFTILSAEQAVIRATRKLAEAREDAERDPNILAASEALEAAQRALSEVLA